MSESPLPEWELAMGKQVQVSLDIPEFDPRDGSLVREIVAGERVAVTILGARGCVIEANPAGLRALARLCLTLAQQEVPAGHHFHIDAADYAIDSTTGADLVIERSDA